MPWSMPLPPMQPLSEDIDARICRGGDEATAAMREYAAECKALGKSLVALAKRLVPEWIPVSERLPDPWVFVLVSFEDCVFMAAIDSSGQWRDWDGGDIARLATHWMKLPEPPEVPDG